MKKRGFDQYGRRTGLGSITFQEVFKPFPDFIRLVGNSEKDFDISREIKEELDIDFIVRVRYDEVIAFLKSINDDELLRFIIEMGIAASCYNGHYEGCEGKLRYGKNGCIILNRMLNSIEDYAKKRGVI